MEKVRKSAKLDELAELLKGKMLGENCLINDVAGIDDVGEGEITWVENNKTLNQLLNSKAAAVIISDKIYPEIGDSLKIPCIIVSNPRLAFAQTLEYFYKRILPEKGIAATAKLGDDVTVAAGASVGDYTVIGDNTTIAEEAVIFSQVFIGRNVVIKSGALIYPFAVIHDNSVIGSETIIHSGAVIGGDGFGFVVDEKGVHNKIPQVGHVEIGDGAEIGANVTIDRATTGVTKIGAGSKIDNLVQIGHNSQMGRNCIMVSQSGIAGSTVLGDNVTLAAQAGTAPHVKIGSYTTVAGRGGVTHDIPVKSVVSGFPAKPHREALRVNASVQLLPATMKTVKKMEHRIAELEKKIEELVKSDDG